MTTRKAKSTKPASFGTGAEWCVIYLNGPEDQLLYSLFGPQPQWFRTKAAAQKAAITHAKHRRPVVVLRVVTRIDHTVIPEVVELSSGTWQVTQQNVPVPSRDGKVCLTVRRKS